MDVSIVPLRGRGGVTRFVRALAALHDPAQHPQWVPTLPALEKRLLGRRHPFWRRADRALFLAVRGREVVGRIAAIDNRAHTDLHGDRVGFFGFFAVRDDRVAARALVDAAGGWLHARGLERIRGPVSPSMNYECGVLTEGFERPNAFLTPWNPPWYGPHLEAAGLAPAQVLVAAWCPTDRPLPDRIARAVEVARRRGSLTFRDGSRRDFSHQAELLRTLFNEAWAGTWGFVPIPAEEFADFAAAGRHVLLERFGFFAESDGETVGFVLVVPDYNEVLAGPGWRRWLPVAAARMLVARDRLRKGRIMLLGLREAYRGSRLLPLFMDELMRRGRQYGAVGAEASWLLEDGLMHRATEAAGMDTTRRWMIYEGDVEAEEEGVRRG